MANKKRWISKIESDSQELINEISCSSSDSEHENAEMGINKKIKLSLLSSEHIVEPSMLDVFEKGYPKNNVNGAQNMKWHSGISDYTFEPSISISSPINKYELEGTSPIIVQKAITDGSGFEYESPVLSCSLAEEKLSPVLTNSNQLQIIKNMRKKYISTKPPKIPYIEHSSPDLFLSQTTYVIEENGSPEYTTQKNSDTINTLDQIEVISSQDSSSITVINPSSSSGSVTDLVQCYHQPNPIKKICKKGGLLHQLRNILRLQTSRVSIWHHDIFVKNITPSDIEHISCVVENKWKDFGCDVLECSVNATHKDLFLVCLGNNMNYNLFYDIKQIIKVFPPFKKKMIKYQDKEVEFYYNISKVLTDKFPS